MFKPHTNGVLTLLPYRKCLQLDPDLLPLGSLEDKLEFSLFCENTLIGPENLHELTVFFPNVSGLGVPGRKYAPFFGNHGV